MESALLIGQNTNTKKKIKQISIGQISYIELNKCMNFE